ncbi:MAG: HU family DNA-binding protein [Chloroflexi bacterium]|nr:HU family DNA-binding protein [Chloroflexota bacterium]
MYKKDLVKAAAAKAGLSEAQMKTALDAMLEVVSEALQAGERVQLTGFGTFNVSERKARTGRNPRTGEPLHIPARTVPTFKAGKGLKEAVNASPESEEKKTEKKTERVAEPAAA